MAAACEGSLSRGCCNSHVYSSLARAACPSFRRILAADRKATPSSGCSLQNTRARLLAVCRSQWVNYATRLRRTEGNLNAASNARRAAWVWPISLAIPPISMSVLCAPSRAAASPLRSGRVSKLKCSLTSRVDIGLWASCGSVAPGRSDGP